MKDFLRVALVGAAALLLPVQANAADNEKICGSTTAQGYTFDEIVAACTSYIDSVNYSGLRAGGFYNRGNAYYDHGEFAKAIADYDEALKLRPKYPTAMFNRGLAKKRSGDAAGGDADIAASKTLKAN